MAKHHNPRIVTNNLLLCLDAQNIKSVKSRRSIINWNDWTVGTGPTASYSQNGDVSTRILAPNPWGSSDVVWQSLNNDAASDGDGGWNTSIFPIDNTKMYRFTTWVKRKVLGDGSFYMGLRGYDTAESNIGVLARSSGSLNTNPYFTYFSWTLNIDQWYLVVGHVWPMGSGTGSNHIDSGVYDLSGNKVLPVNDYVWQVTNTKALHRSYLFYSTLAVTDQYWYQPRVDLCDGTEPTILDILNNSANKVNDISGNTSALVMYNTQYITTPGNYIQFTRSASTPKHGGNLSATMTGSLTSTNFLYNDHTWEIWFRIDDRTPGNYDATEGNSILSVYQGYHAGFFYSADAIYYQMWSGTSTMPTCASWSLGTSGTNVIQGNWYQIVVTRSGNIFTPYVNGVVLGSGSTNSPSPTGIGTGNNISLGSAAQLSAGSGSYVYYSKVSIANMKMYNRALTAAEISQNFNALRGRFGI